jgi:tripartite-type tricarboxylate transporter receptor subunit TctC
MAEPDVAAWKKIALLYQESVMLVSHIRVTVPSVGLVILVAVAAWGQDFPTKPIRIVAGGVGGGADFAARLVAQGISGPLGQQVIVDNRSSGVIPAQIVAQASPDGYTLHVAGTNFWLGPLMQITPHPFHGSQERQMFSSSIPWCR